MCPDCVRTCGGAGGDGPDPGAVELAGGYQHTDNQTGQKRAKEGREGL